MKLILVRHGETKANLEKRNQDENEPLTAKGKEQAKLVAESLKKLKIDKIYVSTMKRAQQTALPIIKFHPESEIINTDYLRERNLGIYETSEYGVWVKDAIKKGIPLVEYKPKGGESIKENYSRAVKFLKEIIKKDKNKTVVLVSHGTILTQMFFFILKVPDNERQKKYTQIHPFNTAVTIMEIKGINNIKVNLFNSTEHLK